MPAEKNRRHPAQQLELVHLADQADVQQAVIGPRPRRYFHSAAIAMRIAYRNKERRPPDFPLPAVMCISTGLNATSDSSAASTISACALQPRRHAIGARVGLCVHPHARHAAEKYFFARLLSATRCLRVARCLPGQSPRGRSLVRSSLPHKTASTRATQFPRCGFPSTWQNHCRCRQAPPAWVFSVDGDCGR